MREDPELPLDTLPGGFSHTSGEEQQWVEKEHTNEKTLSKGAQKYIISQESPSKSVQNPNKPKRKIRRGGVKKSGSHVSKKSVTSIKVFSTNGAGIKNGKVASLNAEIESLQANLVTVQETHCTQKGRIVMDSKFVVFEAIRKRKGGGTLVAIHEDLNPKLIAEYDEEFELL